MERLYHSIIEQEFSTDRQMIFLMGPRQVGKTTIAKTSVKPGNRLFYLNWDNEEDKQLILTGSRQIANQLGFEQLAEKKPILVFDKIHKYEPWKNFLKGFFDIYGDLLHIIVTGSAKLDQFSRGGDSLMGRYFPYRVHPLTVAECLRTTLPTTEISPPQQLDADSFANLLQFGGFPEPYTKKSISFKNRWSSLRQKQLFREDIRDLTNVHEIAKLELLATLLKNQVGQAVNYTKLATKLSVSVDTVSKWITILKSFYYCFTIQP